MKPEFMFSLKFLYYMLIFSVHAGHLELISSHQHACPPSHYPMCSSSGGDDASSEKVYPLQATWTQTGGYHVLL